MIIVVGMVTMFVWLSAIIVALFTEVAKASQDWGALSAIIVYCILALFLGITPLAPGSVADAVGGFLLVQILMHESQGYNFYGAFTIALALVIVLHFVGSCLQYFIGKIKSVQQWANYVLSPDILAASDSVLLYADCTMVGIVGQVFMDTFNGLNQGRMNMDFCTQFWSEYASCPTAFSWVATGAVVSVQGESGYEWADDAIPICMLMALTWQFLGTTIGGYKLLTANKDEKFWKNKAKWETVQYFAKQGVKATKEGWSRDCFCLAKNDDCASDTLFEGIKPIHDKWLKNMIESNSVRESKITQKKYNLRRSIAREEHWDMLRRKYFENEVSDNCKLKIKPEYNNLFFTEQPVDDDSKHNDWRQIVVVHGFTLQALLVGIALVSGIYSYLKVAQGIETEVAVQVGLDVLQNVSSTAWAVFGVFNLVVLIYYIRSCLNSLISGSRTLTSMICSCCASPRNFNLETAFKPTWAQRESFESSKSDEHRNESLTKSDGRLYESLTKSEENFNESHNSSNMKAFLVNTSASVSRSIIL